MCKTQALMMHIDAFIQVSFHRLPFEILVQTALVALRFLYLQMNDTNKYLIWNLELIEKQNTIVSLSMMR